MLIDSPRDGFPVFIPSKGRPNGKTFTHMHYPVIVVEPQDEQMYLDAFPGRSIVVLPENDKGIAYVRNYILYLANKHHLKFFWMIDDDIDNFYTRQEGKTVKCTFNELNRHAFSFIQSCDPAGYGPTYSSFLKDDHVSYGTGLEVCVLWNVPRLKLLNVHYDDQVNFKEDRDFSLEIIKRGGVLIKDHRMGFRVPKLGTNKGGLHESYKDTEKYNASIKNFIAKHPGYTAIKRNSNGMLDLQIYWSKARDAGAIKRGKTQEESHEGAEEGSF